MRYANTAFHTALLSSLLLAQASAQYEIDLDVASRFSALTGNDEFFTFSPSITVREDGVASDARVFFTGPNNAFLGAYNSDGQQRSVANSVRLPNMFSVMLFASNPAIPWTVSIEDYGNFYDYEVDVDFSYPFVQHPSILSTTLFDGNTVGTFVWDWAVEGGNGAFPSGESDVFFMRLFQLPDNMLVDKALFTPSQVPTWVPEGDFTSANEFLASIIVRFNELPDFDSLRITDIRKLDDNAPELSFSTLSVHYEAELSATLISPTQISEPSTAVLTVLGLGAFSWRRAWLTSRIV